MPILRGYNVIMSFKNMEASRLLTDGTSFIRNQVSFQRLLIIFINEAGRPGGAVGAGFVLEPLLGY